MVKQLRCLMLFSAAIKSEATKITYLWQLDKFKEWAEIKTYDSLLEAPDKDLQILLEDYTMYLKSKISPNSVPIYFAPIELFYVMNDKTLNFKKIRKLFPEKIKKGNERAYSHEEIRKMLDTCKDYRTRAFVLLLATSGARLGAIPDVRIRHMKKIEDCYAIQIYEGSLQEDYIFTTPETATAIDDYLQQRRNDLETIHDESPLFRTIYETGVINPNPCDKAALSHIVDKLKVPRRKSAKTGRFDVAIHHGFRKFFATTIKQVDTISPTMSEKLINHVGIVQLDGSYFKPTLEQMYESYKKAIPDLTFSNEQRDHLKIEALKKEVETIDNLKTRLEIVERQKEDVQNDLKDKISEHKWDIQVMKNNLIADVLKELEEREKKEKRI